MDSHFGDGTDCRPISDYYEVMANPIDEDTGEFIKLKNVAKKAVDLFDWRTTDGVRPIYCNPTSKERPSCRPMD